MICGVVFCSCRRDRSYALVTLIEWSLAVSYLAISFCSKLIAWTLNSLISYRIIYLDLKDRENGLAQHIVSVICHFGLSELEPASWGFSLSLNFVKHVCNYCCCCCKIKMCTQVINCMILDFTHILLYVSLLSMFCFKKTSQTFTKYTACRAGLGSVRCTHTLLLMVQKQE